MKHRIFGSAMGEFTVAQEGEGWIVLEDGRRVGGTLRYPFPSREAAQRYVERELAGEAEMSRDGRLRSQWQDLPHRRNARREASVRPNKIEWERYTIRRGHKQTVEVQHVHLHSGA